MRVLKIVCLTLGGIFAFLFLLAIFFPQPPQPKGEPARVDTAKRREPPRREAGFVSRPEYGAGWPLTVESGALRCESDYGSAVVIVVNNVKYALNGRARGQIDRTGWRDSREIVRKTEVGSLADVGPLIDRGLALCK